MDFTVKFNTFEWQHEEKIYFLKYNRNSIEHS